MFLVSEVVISRFGCSWLGISFPGSETFEPPLRCVNEEPGILVVGVKRQGAQGRFEGKLKAFLDHGQVGDAQAFLDTWK